MKKIIYSIIIPYRGRYQFVNEAIKSVLNQTIDKNTVEIIAVNDPGGDKLTEKKLRKKYPMVKYIDNEDKEGPGGKRNTGFKHAKGEYVTFLDSDDKLAPNFLERLTDFLENNPGYSAAFCYSKPFFEKGFSLKEHLKLIPLSLIKDFSLISASIFNKGKLFESSFYLSQISHVLFRKNKIMKHKFNYDYRNGGEDWDFFVQAMQKGPIGILPSKLVYYRYSAGSSTDDPVNRVRKWKSYKLLLKRLPRRFKKGVYYRFLLIYIKIFGGKNAKS